MNLSYTDVWPSLTPSQPALTSYNDSFAHLDWKAYSRNNEFYMIEVMYVTPPPVVIENSSTVAIKPAGFENLSFTRGLFLIINKDAEIRQPMCVFRLSGLNVRSISEPSTPTSVLSTKLLPMDEASSKDLNPYSIGKAGANYLTLGRTLAPVPVDHYKMIESRLNKLYRMAISGTLGRQEMSRE